MATATKTITTVRPATTYKLTPPPPAPSETLTHMQLKMQKMAPGLMMLGFVIIVAGLVVGFVNADVASRVFDATPAARAAAQPGSQLFQDLHDSAVTGAWLTSFIFLGMGLLLFSIAITLMGILGGLRTMSENLYNVLSHARAR